MYNLGQDNICSVYLFRWCKSVVENTHVCVPAVKETKDFTEDEFDVIVLAGEEPR